MTRMTPKVGDELEKLRSLVHPAEDQQLDHDPDDPHRPPGEEHRHPEADRAAEVLDEGVRDVTPPACRTSRARN